MWIKFDGKNPIIRWRNEDGQIKETRFTVDRWVHIAESDGKLYLGGEDQKEE